MKSICVMARKEIRSYFHSPLAYIFIGFFVSLSLVFFFFTEEFFGTGRAEVRGFFHWLPATLAMLVCGLTMRQWARENDIGSVELLMTLPASTTEIVLGKFLGSLFLVGLSLLFTLGVPITADIYGALDWGPVIGGYVGAFLMGGAYIAIGLFVSSWFRDQFVALLVSAVICGSFAFASHDMTLGWVAGSPALLSLFESVGFWSRFAGIERGIVEFGDIIYFLSITALFCFLNVAMLRNRRTA